MIRTSIWNHRWGEAPWFVGSPSCRLRTFRFALIFALLSLCPLGSFSLLSPLLGFSCLAASSAPPATGVAADPTVSIASAQASEAFHPPSLKSPDSLCRACSAAHARSSDRTYQIESGAVSGLEGRLNENDAFPRSAWLDPAITAASLQIAGSAIGSGPALFSRAAFFQDLWSPTARLISRSERAP